MLKSVLVVLCIEIVENSYFFYEKDDCRIVIGFRTFSHCFSFEFTFNFLSFCSSLWFLLKKKSLIRSSFLFVK